MKIAVVGKGIDCPEATRDDAYSVGTAIAKARHTTITGGLGGVMLAAAQGAADAGGVVIGIVPLEEPTVDGWPEQAEIIRTGLFHTSRNIVTATACDAMIAVYGGHGTLQEIAFAMDRAIPICCYRTDHWMALTRYGFIDYAVNGGALDLWLSEFC